MKKPEKKTIICGGSPVGGNAIGVRQPWRCPHCRARSYAVACVTCNRDMCEDCISFGTAGKVCGLCKDREEGHKRYDALKAKGRSLPDFDEWYDKNA